MLMFKFSLISFCIGLSVSALAQQGAAPAPAPGENDPYAKAREALRQMHVDAAQPDAIPASTAPGTAPASSSLLIRRERDADRIAEEAERKARLDAIIKAHEESKARRARETEAAQSAAPARATPDAPAAPAPVISAPDSRPAVSPEEDARRRLESILRSPNESSPAAPPSPERPDPKPAAPQPPRAAQPSPQPKAVPQGVPPARQAVPDSSPARASGAPQPESPAKPAPAPKPAPAAPEPARVAQPAPQQKAVAQGVPPGGRSREEIGRRERLEHLLQSQQDNAAKAQAAEEAARRAHAQRQPFVLPSRSAQAEAREAMHQKLNAVGTDAAEPAPARRQELESHTAPSIQPPAPLPAPIIRPQPESAARPIPAPAAPDAYAQASDALRQKMAELDSAHVAPDRISPSPSRAEQRAQERDAARIEREAREKQAAARQEEARKAREADAARIAAEREAIEKQASEQAAARQRLQEESRRLREAEAARIAAAREAAEKQAAEAAIVRQREEEVRNARERETAALRPVQPRTSAIEQEEDAILRRVMEQTTARARAEQEARQALASFSEIPSQPGVMARQAPSAALPTDPTAPLAAPNQTVIAPPPAQSAAAPARTRATANESAKPQIEMPASEGSTKEGRLQELLRRYRADEISPREYHQQRALLLSEP
jgi:hypothetical protein